MAIRSLPNIRNITILMLVISDKSAHPENDVMFKHGILLTLMIRQVSATDFNITAVEVLSLLHEAPRTGIEWPGNRRIYLINAYRK